MRSTKLMAAAATAALMSLAATGTAVAQRQTHGHNKVASGPCRLTLELAPKAVTSGEAAAATGQLICAADSGQTVTLYEQYAGSSGYNAVATTTTSSTGYYTVPTPALTSISNFYVASGTSRSASRTVRVAAHVTLTTTGATEGKPLAITTGLKNGVMFTGTISGVPAGALVTLQRQGSVRGDGWFRIGHTVSVSSGTTGSSSYAITHVFHLPGESNIRVVVHSGRRTINSASEELPVDVSQEQIPTFTIESSVDPLAFGGQVTVQGKIAGVAANTPVTLEGREPGGSFAPVAGAALTNAAGEYSFAALAPTRSVMYRATAGGKSSRMLYEGVRYGLTAAFSATSLAAETPLKVTGAVTPAEEGHLIYLQRANVVGTGASAVRTGFHVVAVGEIGAGGVYAFEYLPRVPGSVLYRVKVPGDYYNGGTATTPTAVTVTAATPGPVAPEPVSSTPLPPTGQQ